MSRRHTRLSDRLQTVALFLQWLLLIRVALLLSGSWRWHGASYYLEATQPLAWLPDLAIRPIEINPFIMEAGPAIVAVLLPGLFSLIAIRLDAVRQRKLVSESL